MREMFIERHLSVKSWGQRRKCSVGFGCSKTRAESSQIHNAWAPRNFIDKIDSAKLIFHETFPFKTCLLVSAISYFLSLFKRGITCTSSFGIVYFVLFCPHAHKEPGMTNWLSLLLLLLFFRLTQSDGAVQQLEQRNLHLKMGYVYVCLFSLMKMISTVNIL